MSKLTNGGIERLSIESVKFVRCLLSCYSLDRCWRSSDSLFASVAGTSATIRNGDMLAIMGRVIRNAPCFESVIFAIEKRVFKR